MELCQFSLITILFILLQAFSILIRLLKKIARQNMLMVQISKGFLENYFYLFPFCSYLYHVWLIPRLIHLGDDVKKNPVPKKDFLPNVL